MLGLAMLRNPRKRFLVPWIFLTGFFFSIPALSANSGATAKRTGKAKTQVISAEQHERDVDMVALAAQQEGIEKIQKLLKKYRGGRKEPTLLIRLGESQQQAASILFRTAHAKAHTSGKSVNLKSYNAQMKDSINTLTSLISRYPQYEEMPLAYYLRGKANEEIKHTASAKKDYLHLVRNFPDVPQAIPAFMSLAQFALDEGNHAAAIPYLKEVEKDPLSPHYPFALYKLAWAYYNLKHIPQALAHAEKHIIFYKVKEEEKDQFGNTMLSSSDVAFRDNMLMDVTVFYLEGFEQKDLDASDALAYFKKLHQGETLGKMMIRFANLLRSHDHNQTLVEYKNQVIESESSRPEALDVVMSVYENQENKKDYAALVQTSRGMITLYAKHQGYELFKEAQKRLLKTAEYLQKVIVKNKTSEGVIKLSKTLAGLYDSFTKIVDPKDSRIPKVHYNLAETLFEIKDYAQSTIHYRWVVEHGDWKTKGTKGSDVADSSLKAIASRYEILRKKEIIPKEIQARKLPDEDEEEIDPLLAEWVNWIDTHVQKTRNPIDEFYFEANRALYVQGQVRKSIQRLKDFSEKYPVSNFSVPSASLAIDTYVATENWDATHELAKDFLDVKVWKEKDFTRKLQKIAADSFYKVTEVHYKDKNYEAALERVDEFLKLYGSSARLADALTLGGSAALALKNPEKAREYYSRLIQEAPQSEGILTALITRAVMNEEQYEFLKAAKDYSAFLALPEKLLKKSDQDLEDIREKTLALFWLGGNTEAFRAALKDKNICTKKLREECHLYEALMLIGDGSAVSQKATALRAFSEARKGYKDNRAAWAALALEGSKHMGYHDRNVTMKLLAYGWDELDPMIQYALLPRISESVPKAFELNRGAVKTYVRLIADEKRITLRVRKIQESEETATKIAKALEWSRIRALVLNEISEFYLDLANELIALPPPKGMPEAELASYQSMIRSIVIPFEDKAQNMRAKSFELASVFAVDTGAFAKISEPFFRDNPSQAESIRPVKLPPAPKKLTVGTFLDKTDPSGDWDDLEEDLEDRPMLLKARWAKALQSGDWAQVSFFNHEAKKKKLLPSDALELMKVVSLSAAGAQGEALALLSDIADDLSGSPRQEALRVLIDYYASTFAREKLQKFVKMLQKTNPGLAIKLRSEIRWADENKTERMPASS